MQHAPINDTARHREGGRSKERRAATHAPDSEPGRRVTEAASLRVGGTWAAKLLPSIAFDLRREPTAGKLHGGIWCSEASCHSSGCKSRQHKSLAANPLTAKTPRHWATRGEAVAKRFWRR